MPPHMSIRTLKGQLAAQEKRLAKLRKQRQSLAKKLQGIDAQIATLEGVGTPSKPKPGKRSAKRIAKKATKKRAKRAKAPRGRTLIESIRDVLIGCKEGMSPKQIAETVIQAGYRTTSTNLANGVSVALAGSKAFRRVGHGRWVVAL